MLPFHLRDSRHGAKKGAKRQRCHKIQDEYTNTESGGPVQSAITNDLIDLRTTFREQLKLLGHKNQGADSYSPNHTGSGTAFSIFKNVFGSSKIGMLHLLPPARCDREAYSQLIYAACLALFKESFGKIERRKFSDNSLGETEDNNSSSSSSSSNNDSANHYDDAGFAIFALLALFETNPLPRRIGSENPLEFLPISLRSSEDPRSSYRRCFSKRIRVDRYHYALMLRLKELSMAQKSNCERLFYDLQRLDLKTSLPGESRGFPSDCIYGMSTDILEVLERIFSRLELCEYTGPVGAEAFAGHAEYPNDASITICHKSEREMNKLTFPQTHSQGVVNDEHYRVESSNNEHANDVKSLLRTYKKSVTAIRIPPSKANAVKRLQSALQPIFSQTDNMRLDYSREDQEHQYIDKTDSRFQNETDPNEVESDKAHGQKVQLCFDENHKESESSKYSNLLRNYKVILKDDFNDDLKKALHASMIFALTRDERMSPFSGIANGTSKSTLDADEVSSIDDGGISIGIHRGGPPGTLNSTGDKNLASRKFRLKNQRKSEHKITKKNVANEFLTSKRSIDPVASSEEDSVDSEITLHSFSDSEGIEEDEVSVATSAFGKKALEDLLQNVTEEDIHIDGIKTKRHNSKKKKARRKPTKKQSTRKIGIKASLSESKDNDEDGEMSVATSAFGKRALENLLKNVTQEETYIDDNNTNNRRRNKKKSKTQTTKKQKRRKTDTKASSFGSKDENDNEERSVATSAFGNRALEDLLQSVDQDYIDKNGKNVDQCNNTKRKSKPETTKNQKRRKTGTKPPSFESKNKRENEEASVATSAFGKRALDDLLQNFVHDGIDKNGKNVDQCNNTKQKSKQKNVKTQKKGKPATQASSFESKNEADDETSAFGKRALEDLLHNVAQEHIYTGDKKGKAGIKTSLSESKDNEDEEMSVATSAFGKRALEDLLQNVAKK